MIDFKLVFVFRWMICTQFNHIWHHFTYIYDIVHLIFFYYFLFLDMHMQMCVPPNIGLICGLVLIFLCRLLSVSADTDMASDKSQFI